MTIKTTQSNSGITLVELAIVLVIIGVIVAGAMAGQSMIHNAKISSVITDFQSYRTAVATFKTQYHQLPGDMSDAANFFDNAADGNGDGKILSHTTEALDAWQHLTKAESIKETYTGIYAGQTPFVGTDVPSSAFKGTGFFLLFHTKRAASGAVDALNGGNFIKYAKPHATVGSTLNSAISAIDAATIDDKLDDGNPTSGELFAMDGTDQAGNCINTATAPDSYKNTENDTCQLLFIID